LGPTKGCHKSQPQLIRSNCPKGSPAPSFRTDGQSINAADPSHSSRSMQVDRLRKFAWHRHGSTWRDGGQDQARSRGTSTGTSSPELCTVAIHPASLPSTTNKSSGNHFYDGTLLIQRATRPRTAIVPHTLLLGQSGNER